MPERTPAFRLAVALMLWLPMLWASVGCSRSKPTPSVAAAEVPEPRPSTATPPTSAPVEKAEPRVADRIKQLTSPDLAVRRAAPVPRGNDRDQLNAHRHRQRPAARARTCGDNALSVAARFAHDRAAGPGAPVRCVRDPTRPGGQGPERSVRPHRPRHAAFVGLAHAGGCEVVRWGWIGTRYEIRSRTAKLALNAVTRVRGGSFESGGSQILCAAY